MDARRTPPRYTVPPSPSNLLLGFMSRRFSRVHVFGVGIVDPAWRQMQGDQCRVPRVGCRYPMGYPLGLLGAPWLVVGMPQPAGNTVGLAGQEPRPLQEGVGVKQAFPIRATVPVVAGFHPASPRCPSYDTLPPRSGTIVSAGIRPMLTSIATSSTQKRRWERGRGKGGERVRGCPAYSASTVTRQLPPV